MSNDVQTTHYTREEERLLLGIARQTLEAAVSNRPQPPLKVDTLPARLQEKRACFVTLNMDHDLRGCTGTLSARRALAEEVAYTTVQTAFHDPRFYPVTPQEVPHIKIEISVLTPSESLHFTSPDDLIKRLRPNIDGVTLRLGSYRSTFLPQVWERVNDPVEFLTLLSRKMGLAGDTWKHPDLQVETYQTVMMEEP